MRRSPVHYVEHGKGFLPTEGFLGPYSRRVLGSLLPKIKKKETKRNLGREYEPLQATCELRQHTPKKEGLAKAMVLPCLALRQKKANGVPSIHTASPHHETCPDTTRHTNVTGGSRGFSQWTITPGGTWRKKSVAAASRERVR